ncbi:mRNA cap guanine-N7 methyltransferase [Coemansia sp. RSA 1813]|nr:mRNA cap guanine-N7 methyltransferase [Coemansia sp. RSA 1646]KAJ1766257.1 mRNA cap guanine-N7 methyltransferase [Coemansia sp. RSA 1843]KAJ2085904.1 mRNA cap guanine-N7 methyltransferase [Coemansia sp. RSA 986]KAJ2214400.1 mRNA cap guanine-N7 methyltransferase [Coemansia sp. RSA 487]KAJ2563574.1 mRNA cap guanine-N7 methyltransferase [Coemansia sp. RSA 1813]
MKRKLSPPHDRAVEPPSPPSHDRDENPSKLNNDGNAAANLVAQHYNSRRQLGVRDRLHTKITGLRIFNNWTKSVLINRHASRGSRVLDLGCGKGGDLRKWAHANIGEYVGMDIASVSVEQAQERYNEMRRICKFPARFFAQDCYGEPLEKTMHPPDYQADLISAQFCLHYAFESETKARQMMSNVATHLAPGGAFICTIPNSNWLVKKARSAGSKSFGNSVYSVEFAEYPDTDSSIARFGCAYSFTLDEAVDDCMEYLVHMPSFVSLAQEHGLELLYCRPFHSMYVESMADPAYSGLFWKMRVVEESRPEITPDEWEAIGIYMAVAFVKK